MPKDLFPLKARISHEIKETLTDNQSLLVKIAHVIAEGTQNTPGRHSGEQQDDFEMRVEDILARHLSKVVSQLIDNLEDGAPPEKDLNL